MKSAAITPEGGVSSPVVFSEGWRLGREVSYRA